MDLSKIKMVVTDMDGTLLNSNHEVSTRFFELFKELKKRNILFVAASGRQYNSIVHKLDAIRDDIIIVSENGAFAKKQNKEILISPLDHKKVLEVLHLVSKIDGAYITLCCKYKAYTGGESEDFISILGEYYSNFDIVDLSKALPKEILKIAIYHFESSENYIYPAIKHLEGQLKVKISGPNWVDVSSINTHKGYAIKKLMTNFNIQPDELMVFGDYHNDLEMLSLTQYSFAMKNAHPDALKAANFTTTSNDDFGVERILEKLISQN